MNRNTLQVICTAIFFALSLGTASNAFAQESESAESGNSDETAATDTADSTEADAPEDSESPGLYSFRPGRIDAHGAIGLGGLMYVTFEPGVDVSVVPLGDGVTLSFGGTAEIGYCLLCGVASAAFGSQFSMSAWNLAPQGRALVHFDALGEAVDAPIDAFAGLSVGPNTYFLNVKSGGAKLSETITTFVFTPLFGLRVLPSESGRFFGFGEVRYRTEWGRSRVVLKSDEWNQNFVWNDSFTRGGVDIVFGGGFRF